MPTNHRSSRSSTGRMYSPSCRSNMTLSPSGVTRKASVGLNTTEHPCSHIWETERSEWESSGNQCPAPIELSGTRLPSGSRALTFSAPLPRVSVRAPVAVKIAVLTRDISFLSHFCRLIRVSVAPLSTTRNCGLVLLRVSRARPSRCSLLTVSASFLSLSASAGEMWTTPRPWGLSRVCWWRRLSPFFLVEARRLLFDSCSVICVWAFA